MTKIEARDKIIAACNRWKWKNAGEKLMLPKLFSKRHIQQAVFMARQSKLVEDDILIDAGYNTRKMK